MRKLPIAVAAFVPVCALAACSQSEDGTTVDRRGHHPDAAVAQPDAAPAPSGDIVSCYTEGNPTATCTLPVHCCFSNYSSEHDGFCTSNACTWGTIDCDGPEDCATGEHCCSHVLRSSDGSLAGYSIGCQASACGDAPASYELCHTAAPACSNGGTCVSAYGTANDLPRTLDVCD